MYIYVNWMKCSKCKCTNTIFYKRKDSKRVSSCCKLCHLDEQKEINRRYYRKNRKKINKISKEYRDTNKLKIKKNKKKYYIKNRTKILEYKKNNYISIKKESPIKNIINRDRIRQREFFKSDNFYLLETL